MQTNATNDPGSPAPGVIPEPVRVEDDSAAADRRPRNGAWARLLRVLRGDKRQKARSDESAAADDGSRDPS